MSQIPLPSVGVLNLAGSLGRAGQAHRDVQQSGRDFGALVQSQAGSAPVLETVEQTEFSSERDAQAFYYKPSSEEDAESRERDQSSPSGRPLSDALQPYRSHRPADPHGELGTRIDLEV